ncbi:MFS transporter [Metallosphaera javensis (ex Sakai et al. 2022)]|uniref:MFS transporter n=1 Tax=Metallosphaera javensis (ex Sakai et al. 2022) TaxID=2775498 RepID=UPI00258FF78E|nr:MAG: putative sialic acid transporter [Metallosphaera javensis (ex Sakai et al. 2022)]
MFTISYNTTFVSIELKQLSHIFHTTGILFVLLGTASLWTAIAGALIFGFISNFKGRKAVYGFECLFLAIGSILGALTTNAVELVITQMIFGIGIGGDFVLSPIVVGEFSEIRDRGKLLAFSVGVTGPIGSVVSAGTILLLNALNVSPDLSWRIVLALGAIIPGSVIYLRRKVPESPRYLARIKGDLKELENVIKTVARKDVNLDADVRDRTPVLFYIRKYAWFIFIAGFLWFLDHMVNPGGVFELALVAYPLGIKDLALFSLLITLLASIPGGIVNLLLIDRWGRKPLEAVGFVGMGVALILFFVLKVTVLKSPEGLVPLVAALILAGYHFFHNVGPANVSAAGVFNVELVPTKIRGIASGITVAIDRTGALANSAIFPFLVTNFGIGLAVGIGGFLGILAAMITMLLVPETKGKSLEEASREEEVARLAGNAEKQRGLDYEEKK